MGQLYLITCFVQKGKGDFVVRDVIKAGASGATYFSGLGSGVRRKLGMTIMPEKEIILIVTRESETKAVFEAAVEAGRLLEKGMGFAYISKVEEALDFE